jgi:CcmD family protein
MTLLEQGPAQTTGYMVLGYAVIFSVMLLYLISLAVRSRNLQRNLKSLKEPEKK